MGHKAQVAKDKGNAAFKSGDYPNAIGHYTAAILADPNDHTLPLNRSAAYLKLGKNEDAERDCTTVLSLNASNVKALYRRGQARLGMEKLDDALGDFTEASRREPANELVREELKKAAAMIEKAKSNKSMMKTTLSAHTTLPRRRRVPIAIVEPADSSTTSPRPPSPKLKNRSPDATPTDSAPGSTAQNEMLKHVSSNRLVRPQTNGSPSTSSDTPSTLVPPISASGSPPRAKSSRTFRDTKKVREEAKQSRVGGGIFRASGSNTIFPARAGKICTDPDPAPTPISVPLNATPSVIPSHLPIPLTITTASAPQPTLFDFTRIWESASTPEERWHLILGISPSSIPTMFKASLEPALLVSIVGTFWAMVGVNGDDEGMKHVVREYMDSFANIPRFGTVILLLNKQEKEIARKVWKALGVERVEGGWGTIGE